jgi:hypothetical protein
VDPAPRPRAARCPTHHPRHHQSPRRETITNLKITKEPR